MTFTNIMHTPSPPIEIRQHEDNVEINYEFMDVHRRVRLDGSLANAPYTVADHPHMGRSIGRYDGEELVVETVDVEAGYLDTLGFAGLPQSAQMRTEERFKPDGDRLTVVVTHYDPVYYTKPMVMTYEFVRVDTQDHGVGLHARGRELRGTPRSGGARISRRATQTTARRRSVRRPQRPLSTSTLERRSRPSRPRVTPFSTATVKMVRT